MKDPVKNMKWAYYSVGDITQLFGENPDLYQNTSTANIGHNGVDIVRPHGEHLYAVEDGFVAKTKEDPSGYGKNIRILSPVNVRGRYHDWVYAHLDKIYVKPGDEVKAGQFIGTMGNTGFVVSNSTANGFWDYNPYAGTHLHLGVRDVQKDANGWQYDDFCPKVRVVNYNNGYKGRYDPLKLFISEHKASYKLLNFSKGQDEEDKTQLSLSFPMV